MSRYFTLHGREVVRAIDHHTWTAWFAATDPLQRVIAAEGINGIWVNTAFLGLPSVVFQTMVFGGALDGRCFKWTTYDEAMDGHDEVVKLIKD